MNTKARLFCFVGKYSLWNPPQNMFWFSVFLEFCFFQLAFIFSGGFFGLPETSCIDPDRFSKVFIDYRPFSTVFSLKNVCPWAKVLILSCTK